MRIFLLSFNIFTSFSTSDELKNRWTNDYHRLSRIA
jgi:hypothetical protein